MRDADRARRALLMIFEDVHWTDPSSLETFGRAIDRVRSLPVLLIVTFRPEFEPPWIGRPYVTALTINRLAQRDIEAMIDRVVGNKLIPANVRQDIIERTDGIPLMLELYPPRLPRKWGTDAERDERVSVRAIAKSAPEGERPAAGWAVPRRLVDERSDIVTIEHGTRLLIPPTRTHRMSARIHVDG